MVTGLLGRKMGMTQIFGANGEVIPVTVLKAGPCVVVQRKSAAKEGYDAAQIGLVEFVKPQRVNKPAAGHYKAANVEPTKMLREVRLADGDETKIGDRVTASDLFKLKEKVDVVGVSKGRGFAGAVKRHHFRGGDKSHGSLFHRAPGSIGASSFPSRVWPGMRMPGHLGDARITVRNLEVVQIDADDNLLLLRGAVPGPKGALVMIRHAKKVSKR